jgi:hypothetical protein
MKSFTQLREELDEINFKLDHKKNHISSTKIKKTDVMYHAEKPGSKKVRVFVKPTGVKEPEELGVFKDMKTAEKSASQFVKLMGEDMDEGVSLLKSLVEKAQDKYVQEISEAKEFPQVDIDKINDLTDRNDHGGAVKLLAKLLGLKKEEKIMGKIIEIHKIAGHMSPVLISYRNEIRNKCLDLAKKKYSNGIDVYRAF